jgi:8-oxo-dGTP pyrophosphatase MutT (NUDIX family)
MTNLENVRDAMGSHQPRLLPHEAKRRAAVAMVLCIESGALRILFIERTEREGDPWSGHLAFPGGQMEKHDQTLRDTAERETREEIGMDLSSAEYLGRLDDVTGASVPVVVSGFVYAAARRGELVLNEEVQDAFWIVLSDLLNPERHTGYRFQSRGAERTAPAIDLLGPGRPLLWGLTYRFVTQFLTLIGQ